MKIAGYAILSLFLAFSVDLASAAEQPKPTKSLLVKNPPSGPTKRKIVWKVVEKASSNTIVGDPTADGAQIRVQLTPGGDQCFSMPASGWKAIGSIGFKYKDRKLLMGAVKTARIKKTRAGTFILKVVLSGKGSQAITIAPGNPTASYGVNFEINGLGDEYCSGTGTATPKRNDGKTFRTTNDTVPASCINPCSA
jgi:hypothetical protein